MDKFRTLAKRQIAKAEAEGKLTGLAGEGARLTDRPLETGEQTAVSAGLRIMAEAGVLPDEFTLKKALDAARAKYSGSSDPGVQKTLMRGIADLELRYQIAREARQKFMR